MNKLKNIAITLILMLSMAGILGTKAYASSLDMGLSSYAGSNKMYCIEEGQRVSSAPIMYNQTGSVTITGNEAVNTNTGATITNESNGVLAWILAQYPKTQTDGSNYRVKENSVTAAGVWGYIGTWFANVGSKIGINLSHMSNMSSSLWSRYKPTAEAYAKSISNVKEVKNNTNLDNIKIDEVEVNGTQYCIVGPFNWTFGGDITNFDVKDQNGNSISGMKVGTYSGSNLQIIDSSKIQSDKDFYVLVPVTSGTSKITKLTADFSSQVIRAYVGFYQASLGSWQNMIYISKLEYVTQTTPFSLEVDIPLIGNIKIVKVNKYNHEIALAGVGFYIHNKDTDKWVKQDGDTITYVDSKDQATEFVTDENGEIEIDKLVVGNYEAFESKNPNYGYEMPTDGLPLKIVAGTTTDNTLENKQIYVKLSGYVWIDIPSGKQTVDDEKYTQDIDYRVDNIPVRLVDSSGNVVTNKDGKKFETTTTEVTDDILNEDKTVGAFLFEDVPLNDDPDNPLGDYHFEFDYNGLVYTNVTPMVDGDPKSAYSSKAAEFETTTGNIEGRDNFNVKLNGVQSDGPGTNTGTAGNVKFTYEKGQKESQDVDNSYKQFVLTPDYVVNGESGKSPSAHYEPRTDEIDGQKQAIAYDYDADGNRIEQIREETKITASTEATGYNLNDVFTWGDEIVRHNNLGIYKREQPDAGLIKDINSVAVTYKGYNHIYQYAKRFEHPNSDEAPGYDVGVKYGSEYGTTQFSQPIYEADYEEAIKEGKPDEMNAYITYAIGLRNQSTDLTVQINTVIDYFDDAYSDAEIVVGDHLDDKSSTAIDAGWEPTTEQAEGGYKKLTIPCNIQIEPQKEAIIYVQFKLDANQVKKIIEGDDGSVESDLLYNVAEIGSYSTLKDGADYAGIDVDSNPGNALVNGDVDENNRPKADSDHYYEDDTDIAPAFRLKQADPREANGVAFVDDIVPPADGVDTTGLMTGYERRGNGHLEDSEKKLSGVTVELIEANDDGTPVKDTDGVTDKIAKLFNPDATNPEDQWPDAKTTTDANGLYKFTGYVPGKYLIKFTWGDGEHKVQYYKSTAYIYTNDYTATRYNNNSTGENKYYWYKKEEPERYSDAIDDATQRKLIDDQMKHLTYDQQHTIDNYTVSTDDNPQTATINGEPIIDKMNSYTLLMDMGIEYKDQNEYADVSADNITSKETSDATKAGPYIAGDIDFGIAERPKQALELDKRVTGMKVTLANGQVLVDVKVDKDGKLEGSSANLVYLSPGETPYQGLLRLELDNELIQGALVEVTYEITATNISETDYVFTQPGGDKLTEADWIVANPHYYFGTANEEPLVTLNPSTVIDYLDSDWAYESDKNQGWTILTTESLDDFFKADTGGSIHGIDGSVSGLKNDPTNGTSGTINRYTVLYSTEFNKDLVPGKNTGGPDLTNGSTSHQLNVNKTLTTTDEIELDNQAEVVEVNKPGGSGLDETPGNSNPDGDFTSGTKEFDNDKAETVIVTPNTGANRNFILPISVGAVALIILGVGVVLIRKKVLHS